MSRVGQAGAGGDGTVDRGERAGDIEEPVRLGAADAELRGAVRLPAAVPQRQPDAGGVRAADLGGEDRHGAPDSSIASRSPAVISRARATVSGGRPGSTPCS
nr:hypothetical protein StreXyl84_79710 [Streptomyces sp. Xyl84]